MSINRFAQSFIAVPLAFLAFCLIVSIWWAADREPPFTYAGNPVAERIGRNEITLQYDVVRHRICPVVATRWLRNNEGYRHYLPDVRISADAVRELEQQVHGKVKLTLQIPEALIAGKWIYDVTLYYECNPVHRVWPIVVAFGVPFEVTDGKPVP